MKNKIINLVTIARIFRFKASKILERVSKNFPKVKKFDCTKNLVFHRVSLK